MDNKAENMNEEPQKRGNFILRQELTTLTPDCNIKCSIICNTILMVIFFMFGGSIVGSANSVVEAVQEYSNCSTNTSNTICKVQINVTQTMNPPVFFYYQLEGFYQNQRDYVKSRDYGQMRAAYINGSTVNSKCAGAKTIKEIFDGDTSRYKNKWNHTFKEDELAVPCGLGAKSFFNDTFKLSFSNGTQIPINENGIANSYDKNYAFKNNDNFTYVQWLDMTDEHFIVWMQMETFPNFRKLWGRIPDQIINPGVYDVTINNLFNVNQYGVKKYVVLSTSSALGYSSLFGIFLIIGGCVAFVVIVVFLVLVKLDKHKVSEETNINNLKWE